MLLTSYSPICLEPSVDVSSVNNRLHFNQKKHNSSLYKQYLRRRYLSLRQQYSRRKSEHKVTENAHKVCPTFCYYFSYSACRFMEIYNGFSFYYLLFSL